MNIEYFDFTKTHKDNWGFLERLDKIKAKFEKNVLKTVTCWIWLGTKDNDGYGKIDFYGTQSAHRTIWYLYYGYHPGKMHVCHKCNNTSCCNPNHLYLGTPKDNGRDRTKHNIEKFNRWIYEKIQKEDEIDYGRKEDRESVSEM